MACGCLTTECIELFADLCAEFVELPITATETGTHQIGVEFNGAHLRRSFEAVTGAKIVVPNLFNGDYTHQVRIYSPNGDFTCYKIKIMPATWHSPLPYPPTTTGGYTESYVFAFGDAPALRDGREPDATFPNGTTFQSDLLIGAEITVRHGAVPVAPEEGGYSFYPTTGSGEFDFEVADSNVYILAEYSVAPAPPVADMLLTEEGDYLITEDNDNIIL